jgi:hypothetical protein
MIKTGAVIAAAVTVAGTVAGWASAQAQPMTATSHPAAQHFVLIDHTGPTNVDDVAPRGPSVGDSFTFSEKVARQGRNVGVAGGRCTEIAVTAASTSQLCVITAVLTEGQITVEGIARYQTTGTPGAVEYGIVGGTGAYRATRGQVTVTPVKDGSDRIVVDIITG